MRLRFASLYAAENGDFWFCLKKNVDMEWQMAVILSLLTLRTDHNNQVSGFENNLGWGESGSPEIVGLSSQRVNITCRKVRKV